MILAVNSVYRLGLVDKSVVMFKFVELDLVFSVVIVVCLSFVFVCICFFGYVVVI